ncbi:MAG: hypothetical protein JNL87_02330 [Burkholderiaceae bacterium]|nr:hypothetical protein [Burkholderiaceae bacterium]
MSDRGRRDLPVMLRIATAVGLLVAVLGSASLAWMADASLNPDAAAAAQAVQAAADPKTAQDVVTALRQVVGSEP